MRLQLGLPLGVLAAHVIEPGTLPLARFRVVARRERAKPGRERSDDARVARPADADLLRVIVNLDDPRLRADQLLALVLAGVQADFRPDQDDEIGRLKLVKRLVVLRVRVAEADLPVVGYQAARGLEGEYRHVETPRAGGERRRINRAPRGAADDHHRPGGAIEQFRGRSDRT